MSLALFLLITFKEVESQYVAVRIGTLMNILISHISHQNRITSRFVQSELLSETAFGSPDV